MIVRATVPLFIILNVIPFRSGETHAGEAFASCKDDAAVLVVPGILLVLPQHRNRN